MTRKKGNAADGLFQQSINQQGADMQVKTYPEYSINYPLLLTTFMKRPVKLYPDRIGVVYRSPDTKTYFRFTWRQWYERTCRLANVLRSLGIEPGKPKKPGHRVATMALNHHRHLELYYAVSCSGAVLHPVNIRLSLEHIIHTIRHAQDKILFFDDEFLPMVETIYDRIKDTVKSFVYLSDASSGPKTKLKDILVYEDLLSEPSPEFDWPLLHEDTYATLCYTTGTTGLPKGVMFSHRALYLLSIHKLTRDWLNNDPALVKLGEREVVLLNTPLYHIHGWGYPYQYLFSANKLVFPGKFTAEGFCDLVQTEKVTMSNLVPTSLTMLIEYPDLKKYDLSSLKNIGVGGAALPLGLKAKAEELIPGFTATSAYGMTETAPSIVGAFIKLGMEEGSKEELDRVRVKTGIPIVGLEVEVVDEQGKPVARDDSTIGQIVVRGPWVMEEYYKDPEKTAAVWHDGWFHTGDVAKVDGEGYLTIADRVSDMIRSGAEMVPTVLLENVAASADFILEATFVGVPDAKWGQRPMAIVTLVAGSDKTEADVLDYLEREGMEKGKIAKWMLPDYILITNDIPKTSVGKFNKLFIKENMESYLAGAKKMR
jgi:acyl-CoA synthetase (AMP-forming)/AMP-acid ligase II